MIIHYARKTLTLFMVFMLGGIGLPWNYTRAFFNDVERANQNTLSVGSLDFSLVSADNFAPVITPTQSSYRNVNVINDGSLNFQYRAIIDNLGGNSALCNALNLAVSLEGTPVYNGSLVNFVLDTTTNIGAFTFEVNLTDSAFALQNQSCTFDFVFTAWQDDLPDESSGFSDIEVLSNTVNSGNWNGVVLNEILPNPEGDDDQAGLQGEWVEIYNNGDQQVDLTGWYIEDAFGSGHRQTISAQTTFNGRTVIGVPGSGLEWLVLFIDGSILNNTGDSVTLYTPDGQAVDSHSFSASDYDNDSDSNNTPGGNNQGPSGDETASNEGKSYARIPDGTGGWVDPVPTPGGPNKLSEPDSPADNPTPSSGDFIINPPAEQPLDSNAGDQTEEKSAADVDSADNINNLTNPADDNSAGHDGFDELPGQLDQTQPGVGALSDPGGDEENLTADLSQDGQDKIEETDEIGYSASSDDVNQADTTQLDEFAEQNSAGNGDGVMETANNNETTVEQDNQDQDDSTGQSIDSAGGPIKDAADQSVDNPVETVSDEGINSNLVQPPAPLEEGYYDDRPEESEENIESDPTDEENNLAAKSEANQAESGSDNSGAEPATD